MSIVMIKNLLTKILTEWKLTREQKVKLQKAMDGEVMHFTDDPYVNYCVDVCVSGEIFPYDKSLYEDEVEAWEATGGHMIQ